MSNSQGCVWRERKRSNKINSKLLYIKIYNSFIVGKYLKRMEGGIHGDTDGSAFRDCFSLAWKNPYVLRLALSAGIGGLLFGYDTGKYFPNSISLSSLTLLSSLSLYIYI